MVVANSKVKNRVFLDKRNVIHAIYAGAQTVTSVQIVIERIMKVMNKLIAQDMPVKLLIDIREMGDYDVPARLLEMRARTMLPYWKLAFVTNDQQTVSEQVSRTLTLMSGRRNEIRYFRREDDAIGWLSFMRNERIDK